VKERFMPNAISDTAARSLRGGIVRFSEDLRKTYGEFSRHLDGARLRDELAELHRSFADELMGLIADEVERMCRATGGAARVGLAEATRRDG
jgi:hypothetical protein